MVKLILLKLPLDFVPSRKDWILVKAGTSNKQKKLRRFQTISFRVTMVLYSSFFYTQIASAFGPQKDSYYVHYDTETLFLFF